MTIIDSYAWIEYFLGTQQGETVRQHLTQDPVTPSIVLAEVARKYLREDASEKTVTSRLAYIATKSEISEITEETALDAAKAYFELVEKSRREHLEKPSLADGIILATGRSLSAHILTGDRHFQGLPETIFLR